MKYTLLVTKRCNLRCRYCYVKKGNETMSYPLAEKIIDFIVQRTPQQERIDIGFFGGEPLLEFATIKKINRLIEEKVKSKYDKTFVSIISNGTIFSDQIVEFIDKHNIGFGISCDGVPHAHNANRVFKNGKSSAGTVEKNIEQIKKSINRMFVNVVFQPTTLESLPDSINYLSRLGIRQIYLNPDYSTHWKPHDIEKLKKTFSKIANMYINYYLEGNPHFISLIDSKIALILRGGYHPLERCRMGKGEFAFTPDGNIYPCERLVSSGHTDHCIGNIDTGIERTKIQCNVNEKEKINTQCTSCSLRNHCMNWCGCSNYFSTGYYNRVNSFICESEKASIQEAMKVMETLRDRNNLLFCDHLAGIPLANSLQ